MLDIITYTLYNVITVRNREKEKGEDEMFKLMSNEVKMATLKGSEKQIEWANKIRQELAIQLKKMENKDKLLEDMNFHGDAENNIEAVKNADLKTITINMLERIENAADYIDAYVIDGSAITMVRMHARKILDIEEKEEKVENIEVVENEDLKYEFDHEFLIYEDKMLSRIVALKDFETSRGIVRKGDIGGFIETSDNLSQEGNSWIYDNAKCIGDAVIDGDTVIYDNDIRC